MLPHCGAPGVGPWKVGKVQSADLLGSLANYENQTKPKKKAFASFCSTASSVASHRREDWPVAGSWGGRRGATYRKAREVPGAPPRDEPDPSREDGPKILIFIHVRNKQIFFFFYKSTSEFISVLLLKENIPP